MTIKLLITGLPANRDENGWHSDHPNIGQWLNVMEDLFDLDNVGQYFPSFELAFVEWAKQNLPVSDVQITDPPHPGEDGVVY